MTASGHEWLAGPALLFCPGDRPDWFAKAGAFADMVILDLEDGVRTADKPLARQAIRESKLDPARTIVRVHPHGSPEQADDLKMLDQTSYRIIMVAKAESAADMRTLRGRTVIALCETPLGILNSAALASSELVAALMWGAEDLTAALGGASSRLADGRYTDVVRWARSHVLLAARAYGKPAIDAVYLRHNDLDGLKSEADDAAASGFAGKACVHPRQPIVVRESFTPANDRIAWANEVLRRAPHSPGAFSYDGQMIDEPLLRQARTIAFRARVGVDGLGV